MQGTNGVRVRTKDDLLEMWSDIRKQRSCTLWCDGLVEFGSKCSKSNIRRKHASDDESEEELPRSRKKKKKAANEDRVQEVVDNLRSKQGSKFTTLQLRIWAELISSGLCTSTDEPPSNNSMFQRAGGESSGKIMVSLLLKHLLKQHQQLRLLSLVLQSLHLLLLVQVQVAQQN